MGGFYCSRRDSMKSMKSINSERSVRICYGWIKRLSKVRFLVQAAIVAALYTVLTVFFAPLSFGGQQFRVSEALTVLPAVIPGAIPGLFLGCVLSNSFSFMGLPDMIFGSVATLTSAILTFYLARALKDRSMILRLALIPLPPVTVNALIIGAMLHYIVGLPFPVAALGVLTGQVAACYFVGCPIYLFVENFEKSKGIRLFYNK